METQNKKVVLFIDPEAASLKTVTGWVSRNGKFFGDNEEMARYDGCTHKICDCGNLMEKGWTKCQKCRDKKEIERYNNLEFKEWDGKIPLYSHLANLYFFDDSEIIDYCEDNEIQPEDMRLVLCEPQYFHQIDSEIWANIIPEDTEPPKELKQALDEFNEKIRKLAPASYFPGKFRTTVYNQ